MPEERQARRGLDVSLLVDVSASMDSFGAAVGEGVRDFLEGQMRSARGCCADDNYLEVRLFATSSREILSKKTTNITPGDVDFCVNSVSPDGQTRLYDTVIEAMDCQQVRMSRKNKQSDDHDIDKENSGPLDWSCLVIALLTDGRDTCSWQNGPEEMESRVKAHRAKGGQFVWLQASPGLVAADESAAAGGDPSSSLQVGATQGELRRALATLSEATTRYCAALDLTWDSTSSVDSQGGASSQIAFTSLERLESCAPTERSRAASAPLDAPTAWSAGADYSVGNPLIRIRDGLAEGSSTPPKAKRW